MDVDIVRAQMTEYKIACKDMPDECIVKLRFQIVLRELVKTVDECAPFDEYKTHHCRLSFVTPFGMIWGRFPAKTCQNCEGVQMISGKNLRRNPHTCLSCAEGKTLHGVSVIWCTRCLCGYFSGCIIRGCKDGINFYDTVFVQNPCVLIRAMFYWK